MNGVDLKVRVSRLETFPDYATSLTEVKQAKLQLEGTSFELESARLRVELSLAEAREAIVVPRTIFRSEVANTDILEAPYKIGVLAAMDSPPPPKLFRGINLDIFRTGRIPWFNDDITVKDYATPPHDRFELAAKIGKTIVDLGSQFKPYSSKPLAVLSVGRMRENKSHPTEADYYVRDKRYNHGLEVEAPEELPDGSVRYSLPRMPVVHAVFSPYRQKIVKKSDDVKFLSVPALEQLTHAPYLDPQKLLVGREATRFARRHYAKQRAEHADWQRRNKGVHPLDRRYN